MKHTVLLLAMAAVSSPLFAASNAELQREIQLLRQQTRLLESQLTQLEKRLVQQTDTPKKEAPKKAPVKPSRVPAQNSSNKPVRVEGRRLHNVEPEPFHVAPLTVHQPEGHPDSLGFFPTALVADDRVITWIAGTPVITSPYLGDRPAFDGSDYIVNISSINRDIRLMQQRRRLYRAYEKEGYPAPTVPIVALSGKLEPGGFVSRPYKGPTTGDWDLGSSEIDVAAALNDKVEAFVGFAFDSAPPLFGGQRVDNSSIDLNLGFVNIGDLDETPFYFTAGQIYAPFGRYSTSMISSTLPQLIGRVKTRPVVLGYRSQTASGPYAAVYGFKSDTTVGKSGVGGINAGYIIDNDKVLGELGFSMIGSMADAQGLQNTGSAPLTTFAGFGNPTNGSENVRTVPSIGGHATLNISGYSLTAEWIGATKAFLVQDLSMSGRGAQPQAGQLELGKTFVAFDRPASLAAGYQWTRDSLALNLPRQRYAGVFNISLWRDTVESLEYRHDINYNTNQFANGASTSPFVNANTVGTGTSSDSLIAQIGVFF